MSIHSPEFVKLIQAKTDEVMQRTASGVRATITFKALHAILTSYQERRPDKNNVYVLMISNTNLSALQIDTLSDEIANMLDRALHTCNHIEIDSKVSIIQAASKSFSDSSKARLTYTEMSRSDGMSIFFFNEDGITTFVEGYDDGRTIFFEEAERKAYRKKKDISEIEDVIVDYRSKLKEQNTYRKFFVPKVTLIRLFGKKSYNANKHLLINSPEDAFRDDLLAFLSEKIRATFNFGREFLLESENRLDIWTEDEKGKFYFIEVKWIGESINKNDNEAGTSYSSNYIRKHAVRQVLGYINELIRDWKKTVKVGYLAVFDARKVRDGDSLSDISQATFEYDLAPFRAYFHKIPDFIVDNIHPN